MYQVVINSHFHKSYFPFALALSGTILVLISTAKYGAGLSPDSAIYLSVADHLRSGDGFLTYQMEPLSFWPPLFSSLLAILSLTGVDLHDAARYLNAAAFGVSMLLFHRIVAKFTTAGLTFLADLTMLFAYPVFFCATMTYSEPVFIVLLLLFFVVLLEGVETPGRLTLLIAIAALASLQRYVGGLLIIFGIGLLLFRRSRLNRSQRLVYASLFATLATLPLIIWYFHVHNLGLTMTDTAGFGPLSISNHLNDLSHWFLPAAVPFSLRVTVLLVISVLLIACWAINFRNLNPLNVIILFMILYIGFFLVFSSPVERYLAPMYPLLLAAGFGVIEILLPKEKHRQMALILIAIWTLYPAGRVIKNTIGFYRHGAGGGTYYYSTDSWMKGELRNYILEHPFSGSTMSNVADFVYLTTGRSVQFPPRVNSTWASDLVSDEPILIWHHGTHRTYLVELEDLRKKFELVTVKELTTASIYKLKTRI